MARITSEEAAKKIGCLYNMVIVAAARARELRRGDAPKFNSENKPVLTALKEIERGLIGKDYLRKAKNAIYGKSKNRNRK